MQNHYICMICAHLSQKLFVSICTLFLPIFRLQQFVRFQNIASLGWSELVNDHWSYFEWGVLIIELVPQAVEDRTFCMANAPTTCANSCAGVVTKLIFIPFEILYLSFSVVHRNLHCCLWILVLLPSHLLQCKWTIQTVPIMFSYKFSNVSELQTASTSSYKCCFRWQHQRAQLQLWRQRREVDQTDLWWKKWIANNLIIGTKSNK